MMSILDRGTVRVTRWPVALAAWFIVGGLAGACGDGDHPDTTPRAGSGEGGGSGAGSGTGGEVAPGGGGSEPGAGYAGTSGGGGAAPSPLEAGIDEALAAGGSGTPASAPREILPLSATEAANFQQGVEAFEIRGDDAAAKAAFEAVLASNPTAYRAAYNLGYLAERRGDTREAILNYQRALDIKPDYPIALRALFRLLDRAGRSSEALSQVQSRANAFPDNGELQEILAEAYIAANRADEGIVIARRMLLADANSLEAFQILLRASIQQGRTALTQELLTRIASKLEETVPFDACAGGGSAETRRACKLWAYCRFTLGRIAAEQGRKFEAQQYYQNAIDADPTFVEARVLVAGYQLDGGQLGPAIENLEAARRIAPTWLPVLVGLGNAYRGRGDYAGAIAVLREAERLYPSAPEVPIAIGLVYYDARTANFEGLDRARSDQTALEQFRRAQGLLGGNDAEVAALIQAAQDDYDLATAPAPAPLDVPGGTGDTGGTGDGWGGGWGDEGGATEGGEPSGGGSDDGWGGGGW